MDSNKKTKLHPVESNVEEMEQQIKIHRRKVARKTVIILAIVLFLIFTAALAAALRVYTDYDITESEELKVSSATKYEEFNDCIVTYTNDGIICRSKDFDLEWTQSYEMTDPETCICQSYMAVYDRGGLNLYIMGESGLVKEIDTAHPIQKVAIAKQGTVVVLMKEEETAYTVLYDNQGNELASGEFYGEKGSIPVDVALSYNAQMMAISFIDLSNAKLQSTISFYNFGSVGQNEIDNQVGSFTYDDTVISSIQYVSEKKLVAVGDDMIRVFEGAQKPNLTREIELDHQIQSVFMDSNYIGTIYSNGKEEISYHICVYGPLGNVVMETDADIAYDWVGFMRNHEVCLLNNNQCEIYTIHGVNKFSYTFDQNIYHVYAETGSRDYIFITEEEAEEVRLK